jgi:hypothetical protein
MAHPMLETREIADDNVCGPYKRPIQNVDNETRCVPKLGSCKGKATFYNILKAIISIKVLKIAKGKFKSKLVCVSFKTLTK